MPPFFSYTPTFINTQYIIDIKMMNLFATDIFNGDLSRVLYAPNKYCFRLRTDSNRGELNMPFMNLKCINIQKDNTQNWYAYDLDKRGYYAEEIEAQVHIVPVKLTYEANIWTERDDDAKAVFNRLSFYQDGHERYPVDFKVYSQDRTKFVDMQNMCMFNFTDLSLGNDFTENDWLEKNQIRNITCNFEIYTMTVETTYDAVCVPNTVLFEFTSNFIDADNLTYDEQYEFVVDHILGTVTPV